MKPIVCSWLIAMLSMSFSALAAHGQLDVSWYTVDVGGGSSTDGNLALSGTVGQPDAGVMSDGTFTLTGGFWAAAAPAGVGVPPAVVQAAVLRKTHAVVGPDDLVVNVGGAVENHDVTSESRVGGISELRIQFDVAPGGPGPEPVAILEQVCPGGTQAHYADYSGSSVVGASLAGNELVLTFSPGLENLRTYKLILSPSVTSVADQSIEVRCLRADVNSDGRVNGTDRSTVVLYWTSPGYSTATDINLSGRTNGMDRSMVVGAWTGIEKCAP